MAPPRRRRTGYDGLVLSRVRWLVLVLVLVLVLPGAVVRGTVTEETRCRAGDSLVQGDIVIHGLFTYLGGDDCAAVSQFSRQLETAAEWAVRRVNTHGVLQGGVLGLRSYPICTRSSSLATVVTTQAYTDGADPACVDGTLAGFLSPPLPVAAEALLSELPVTRAVVPTDGGAALVETLAELASELGWTAVTVVTGDHGQRASQLVERLEYLGLCVTRWITVTGRELEAFSELSSLADGSCLVGLFELSQLQLRQLSRLRCLLGLRQPDQLRHVPEGALVAFDVAAEVEELTEVLDTSPAEADTWRGIVSDGTTTTPGVAEEGSKTTTAVDVDVVEVKRRRAAKNLRVRAWKRWKKDSSEEDSSEEDSSEEDSSEEDFVMTKYTPLWRDFVMPIRRATTTIKRTSSQVRRESTTRAKTSATSRPSKRSSQTTKGTTSSSTTLDPMSSPATSLSNPDSTGSTEQPTSQPISSTQANTNATHPEFTTTNPNVNETLPKATKSASTEADQDFGGSNIQELTILTGADLKLPAEARITPEPRTTSGVKGSVDKTDIPTDATTTIEPASSTQEASMPTTRAENSTTSLSSTISSDTEQSYTTTTSSPTTLEMSSPATSTSNPDSTTSTEQPTSQPTSSTPANSKPTFPEFTTSTVSLPPTTATGSSTLPVAWELTAPSTVHPPPFIANPAAVHVVRIVYNYARTMQLQLMRLCPNGACDAASTLRRATDTYSDLGQEFVSALQLTLTPDNVTVYLLGPDGPRAVGWRSGGLLHLSEDASQLTKPELASPAPCPALFTQPMRWRVSVWTTVLATLAAVGALACLCFLCFYAAVSCRRLEHGQGWMALLVAATLLQYACTLPFFLRMGRLVCALRLQAPALGLAAPLSVLLSRALCLAAAHTTRGDFGHVSGMLQSTLCFFIFLVQVGISTERLLTLPWSSSSGGTTPQLSQCANTPYQQLMALGYCMLLQVLQFVLNPWVALCGRNYCEGPLTAVYTCLAVLLWSGALTLYYLDVPLLDSDSSAPQLCLGMIVLASVSLVVIHVPRVLLIVREVTGLGALPHLSRYRDRSASGLGEPTAHLQRYEMRSASALAQAAAMRHPRRRETVEINEAISLHHLDGALTRMDSGESGHERPISTSVAGTSGGRRETHEFQLPPPGGERNHAFQPDDSVSVGDAETASAHSENKYHATTEM